MWDLPGPGLEPVSPALAGRFLTTAPPGKPPGGFLTTVLPGKSHEIVTFIIPFYRGRNWDTEKSSNLPSDIQLVSSKAGIEI